MLFGVECNHKFYVSINCLLLQARFLIFWCKTAKNIPNKYYLVVENIKQLKNELLKSIINSMRTEKNGQDTVRLSNVIT